MPPEQNRISFAKLQILLYGEELYTAICDLLNPDIEALMNLPAHGLFKEELVIVLNELFANHMLVAKRQDRGLFTPSLSEIESALEEKKDLMHLSSNTFYGVTTGAHEIFANLRSLYENDT